MHQSPDSPYSLCSCIKVMRLNTARCTIDPRDTIPALSEITLQRPLLHMHSYSLLFGDTECDDRFTCRARLLQLDAYGRAKHVTIGCLYGIEKCALSQLYRALMQKAARFLVLGTSKSALASLFRHIHIVSVAPPQ